MLKKDGKEFRNLEEQVQKNLEDIQTLNQTFKTGIKIEKSITLEQVPSYTDESHLGQYFLVTDVSSLSFLGSYILVNSDYAKYLYLITLNDSNEVIAENLGEFPARGPKGIQGEQGEKGDPGESIRGPQGIQGVQGIRGRPGEGWDALDEIDATPYTPTFTEQASDIKVETSAVLKTNAGTPDEETKIIGLMFEVPKSGGGGGGSETLYKHLVVLTGGNAIPPNMFAVVVFLPTSTPVTNILDAVRFSKAQPYFTSSDDGFINPVFRYTNSINASDGLIYIYMDSLNYAMYGVEINDADDLEVYSDTITEI